MAQKNFYDRRNFLGTAPKTMAAGSLLVTGVTNAAYLKTNKEATTGTKTACFAKMEF